MPNLIYLITEGLIFTDFTNHASDPHKYENTAKEKKIKNN